MTEDSGKREVGEIFKKPLECEVITWKIPNIYSLVVAVDTEVQSPRFFFNGAPFILKLYPFGCSDIGKLSEVVMGIERLHSELPVRNFAFRFSFKYPFENWHGYFDNFSREFLVFEYCTRKFDSISKSWHEVIYGEHAYRWNDTITLVCEIQTKKDAIAESDSKTKSLDTFLSCKSDMSETSLNPTGELFKESFEMDIIAWKLPNTHSLPVQVDRSVQSPEFSFDGASWILKMFPRGQTKFKSESRVDVVIEKLHSPNAKHSILYEMYFKAYDEKKPLFENYYESKFLRTHLWDKRKYGWFVFDSYHTQENVISVSTHIDNLPVLWDKQRDTVVLECIFLRKKTAEISLESQMESVQLFAEDWWNGKSEIACTEVFTQTEKEIGNDCESVSSIFLHRNKIIEDLKKLYLNQEDCDVIFRVQEKEFPAHLTIVKARSPVLAATFRNDMKEKLTGIVDIEDCNPDTFSDLLCFLYYGELKNLSEENVFNLYSVADKYDVPDLRTICVEFMKEKLSIDTFCKTISLALLHREAELIKLCTDFFAKNLQKIIVTVEWQSFLAQYPTESNELFIKALVPNKT